MRKERFDKKWTREIEDWVRERVPLESGVKKPEFLAELNEHFNTDFTMDAFTTFLRDKKIKLGLRGNNILKEQKHGKYTYIKIGEPCKWEKKQIYLWEQAHGEKVDREKECVIFLDMNVNNFDLDNLYKLTRAELRYLNKQFSQTTNAKERLVYIALTKQRLKLFAMAKERGMTNKARKIKFETHENYLKEKEKLNADISVEERMV